MNREGCGNFTFMAISITGLRIAAAGGLVLLLSGCAGIEYIAQSVSGQWELLAKSEPIPRLLENPATPGDLKRKLALSLEIREFASRELALPYNDSYRYYADLKRPYVVWNVVAAPELSLEPREWCFPVVGCVRYRGYFSEAAARDFAAELRAEGYDVYVGGVAAYSTLGWFDDPLLNTVINRSDAGIAALIFHELAHQQLYIPGDSAFNESFATAVEEEGVRRWLESRGDSGEIRNYRHAKQRHLEFLELVGKARQRLAQLYAAPLSADEKRAGKARVFEELRAEYQVLKERWGGYAGYDAWFAQDLNNAKLAAVATYHQYVPAFRALLQELGGDLPAFYRAAREIGDLPVRQRAERLQALAARAARIAVRPLTTGS